jgi:hypothetical protein
MLVSTTVVSTRIADSRTFPDTHSNWFPDSVPVIADSWR